MNIAIWTNTWALKILTMSHEVEQDKVWICLILLEGPITGKAILSNHILVARLTPPL